ncbi:MAG: squalene/phytoene synthase family protein [Chthoniobacterales bacterium]
MNPLLPPAQLDAAAVVRASRSSFVPAFRLLPADGRADLEILYAFCRAADDVADAEGYAASERYAALEAWRSAFRSPDLQRLPGNLRELIGRRGLDRGLFLELLDGTATDLAAPVRMATRADLDLFLEHQTEIRISPGMTKWLMRDKSDARGMYVPSGWFIDHNDSGEIFLLEMCVPRLVRKTVDIQQR